MRVIEKPLTSSRDYNSGFNAPVRRFVRAPLNCSSGDRFVFQRIR